MIYQTRCLVARREFRMGTTMIRPGDLFACSPTDERYLTRSGRADEYRGTPPTPDQLVWSPSAPAPRTTIIEHGESQKPAPGVVTASTWSEGEPKVESKILAGELPDGTPIAFDVSSTNGTEQATQVVAPEKPADKGLEDDSEGEATPPAPAPSSKPVFNASRTLPRSASPARSGGRSNSRR